MIIAGIASFLFGIFLLKPPAAVHPVFVTVTQIDYNQKQNTLETSTKLFTDDFERALRQDCNCEVDILSNKNQALNDSLIKKYFNKKYSLLADGKAAQIDYLGHEKDKANVFVYTEAAIPKGAKKIVINQNLLFEAFSEQIGIVHLTQGDITESVKLQNPDSVATYDLPLQ